MTRPAARACGACVAAYQATFFAAVADTGVAVGTVVAIGSAPVFTGLLARTFVGERLTGRWAGATALGCAGVCTLVLGSGSGGSVLALALLARAGYAGYAVAGKTQLDQGSTPEALMASVFSIGAVFLVPLLAFIPTDNLLSGPGLALALYLGALPHGTCVHPLRPRPRAHRRRRDG
jgi:drug/metabolite transporter, DME family